MTAEPIYRDAPDRSGVAFKGAAAELIACVHLMRQGHYVFRCESPTAPFDLAAYRDGVMRRVEVKSMHWSTDARARGTHAPSLPWPRNDEWDLLLVVDHHAQVCHEVETHDQRQGIDQIRALHGFGPSPTRVKGPAKRAADRALAPVVASDASEHGLRTTTPDRTCPDAGGPSQLPESVSPDESTLTADEFIDRYYSPGLVSSEFPPRRRDHPREDYTP